MTSLPELISLCLALLAFLAVTMGERLVLPGQSSVLGPVVLLALAFWHQRHFRVKMAWFRADEKSHDAAFGVMLLLLLFLGGSLQATAWATQTRLAWRDLHLLLLVPLAEEYYFRGVLLSYVTRAHGRWSGAVAVTAFFGLLHLPLGADACASAAVLSALTAACLLRWGSLSMAVAVHIAWNGFFLFSGGAATAEAGNMFLVAACLVVPLTMLVSLLPFGGRRSLMVDVTAAAPEGG